jgi:hypothetical protein
MDNFREPWDQITPSAAWDACKSEVLKILKDFKTIDGKTEIYLQENEERFTKMIEEIQKL